MPRRLSRRNRTGCANRRNSRGLRARHGELHAEPELLDGSSLLALGKLGDRDMICDAQC